MAALWCRASVMWARGCRYHLHEFDCAIAAMRRGLAALLPIGLLTALFDGYELERSVCGRPEIDIDLLQRVAHYRGCASTDRYGWPRALGPQRWIVRSQAREGLLGGTAVIFAGGSGRVHPVRACSAPPHQWAR